MSNIVSTSPSFVSNAIVFEENRGYTQAIVCGQFVRLLTKKHIFGWSRLRASQEVIALPEKERVAFYNPALEESHVIEGNNWYW
ncbi:hypothetical protein SAMN05428988_0108 [Chitinophaga sp. YR573]|uniref:hypothetical protein n=1 Tax=Chitinophaga sp. YR573 TaxID=1881040 RepID=UPI0008D6C9BB|nr:hypothetical protein [Chitinophaga sp. YR573]SEV88455.1 hypothetical protein SAMN05428988_0108 [Chitinophaga sp. YR573]